MQQLPSHRWTRYFISKRECVKTTWTFRALFLVVLVVLAVTTQSVWEPGLASALVCPSSERSADAILIENFEPEYLLFEHVAGLRRRGLTGRLLVPTQASPDPDQPALLAGELVAAMARVAHLPSPEMIPVREIEPLSLNVARQVRDFLSRERMRSVIIVTPGFRSRRSALIYQKLLGEAGIVMSCEAVFGSETPDNWFDSWHGRQRVVLELGKMVYYRGYVLPFLGTSVLFTR